MVGECKNQKIEEGCKILPSAQDTAIVILAHSTCGCLNWVCIEMGLQHSCKTGGDQEAQNLTAELLAGYIQGKEQRLLSVVDPLVTLPASKANPYPMVTQILVKPNGFQNKVKSSESGKQTGRRCRRGVHRDGKENINMDRNSIYCIHV